MRTSPTPQRRRRVASPLLALALLAAAMAALAGEPTGTSPAGTFGGSFADPGDIPSNV